MKASGSGPMSGTYLKLGNRKAELCFRPDWADGADGEGEGGKDECVIRTGR